MTQLDGMSRAELDRAEAADVVPRARPMRPRDSATLIVLDRRAGGVSVLMGRRHAGHAFMPGKLVFPGGRTDPGDSRVAVHAPLHPADMVKLADRAVSPSRARAIAMSAIRETCEEAGLLVGAKAPFASKHPAWQEFVRNGVHPSLEHLRYVARAITPPGRVRRFDSRFFAVWRDHVFEAVGAGPSGELEDLVWLPLDDAVEADIPSITRSVLEDLRRRLGDEPDLTAGAPVPFYRMLRNRYVREII